MRQTRAAATLSLILLGAVASASVLAAGGHGGGGSHGGGGWHGGGWHGGSGWHGGHCCGTHVGFGFFFGAPFFPYYAAPYYYPPYYYPPLDAGPAYPSAYVEQGPVQASPPQSQANWLYYCAEAKSYYPYVRECAAGWVRIPPQPPSG
jgi:hypothetical protein